MRTALIASILLLATAARAEEHTGYVDTNRALNDCADGKKAISDLNAAAAARAKAKAAAAASRRPIVPSDDQWGAEHKDRAERASEAIRSRLPWIYRAIIRAKKLSTIRDATTVLAYDPSLDLTLEVIRRLDAGEGRSEADVKDEEIAKLKAENDRLRAAREAKAPVPPSPRK